jgi:Uma2 family endonuclease
MAGKRATCDDLRAVPEHLVAEILGGELVTHPRPASLHARAASSLGGELHGPFDRGKGGPGGWILLDEPELHLHGDILVPDLGGWRRERMPELPDAAAFELSPDWVWEVLSPSTTAVAPGGAVRGVRAGAGESLGEVSRGVRGERRRAPQKW